MGCTIRDSDPTGTFSQALTVDALHHAIPADVITQVIAQEGVKERRARGLTAALTVWIVIAMQLFPTVSISGVLRKLARGLRFLWPNPEIRLPGDSAIATRRRQLGARPLVALFKLRCRPRAPNAGRIPVWVAPDGAGWHVRGCRGYTGQCPRLWVTTREPRRQRLPATAGGVSGRMWHPHGGGRRILTVPDQ